MERISESKEWKRFLETFPTVYYHSFFARLEDRAREFLQNSQTSVFTAFDKNELDELKKAAAQFVKICPDYTIAILSIDPSNFLNEKNIKLINEKVYRTLHSLHDAMFNLGEFQDNFNSGFWNP